MALDFPASPVNGQTYNNYVWDSSVGAWLAQGSTNNVGDQIAGLQAKFPVSAADGGTGRTTLTSGSYLKGNGTSAVTLQAVPIPIADGGTNATTLAGAQDSLQVGLIPMKATSIGKSGASSTVTETTLGRITCVSCETVTINGVFTDAYQNYRVVISYIGTAATFSDIALRFTSGGTPASTNYNRMIQRTNTAGTLASYAGPNEDRAYLVRITSGNSLAGGSFDVLSPRFLRPTKLALTFTGVDATGVASYDGATVHDVYLAYDGFTLFGNPTAAFDATIQVFGYND